MKQHLSLSGFVWVVVLAGALALSLGLFTPHKASAGKCGAAWGYFTNDDYSCPIYNQGATGAKVSPGTFSNADTNKANFIADANGSSARAFYINLMAGQPTTNRQRPPSAALIAKWKGDINNPDIGIKVANETDAENTLSWPAGQDGLPGDYVFFTEASPQAVSSLVFYSKSTGKVYTIIKIDCGNPLNNISLPEPNNPPTGSLSVSCSAAAETYTFKAIFSDPDGATSAQLRGTGGTIWKTASGTSATWTISTKTLGPASFPMELWVKDVGPGASGDFKKVDTAAIANCAPKGTVTQLSCTQFSVKLWDPNDPNGSIQYYFSVNGAAKQGPSSFGGQDASAATRTASNFPGFDYWKNNQVVVYAVDQQTGDQTNVGSVTLPVCGHLSCNSSMTTMPANLVAGESTPFTVWVQISGAPYGPAGAKFTSIKIGSQNTSSAYTPANPDPATILTSTSQSFSAPSTGNYTLTWTFGSGESNPASVTCSTTTQSSYEQYFTVLGGDVSAGQGVTGLNCQANPAPADITGYNLDTSTTHNYFGASSRQAAIATGSINQFATDTTDNMASHLGGSTDGLPVNQPSGLAFANKTPPAGAYGGGFLGSSSQQWCVPNYAASVKGTSGTSLPNLSTLPVNAAGYVYRLSGNQTLGGFTLQPGVHVTVVVNGNAFVNGDIKYAAYTSLQNVPQFSLMVAGGDMYIAPGVQELHGFYDAQPTSSGSEGSLYTCATGIGSPSTDYTTCNHPLTVYGAVSANKIVPGRTYGNVTNAASVTDHPAEQFVYTPEMWLGTVSGSTTSCSADPTQSQCLYQSYTSLPPVL